MTATADASAPAAGHVMEREILGQPTVLARHHDPDAPRGLLKVTKTW